MVWIVTGAVEVVGRGGAGLDFVGGSRRVGAKASDADQPSRDEVLNMDSWKRLCVESRYQQLTCPFPCL